MTSYCDIRPVHPRHYFSLFSENIQLKDRMLFVKFVLLPGGPILACGILTSDV